MSTHIFLLALIFLTASAFAAPSFPNDCDERLRVMDENMKVALLVTDPNAKLYQKESELNDEYCK